MGETVDVLVVGAYHFRRDIILLVLKIDSAGNYGTGKRAGGVSTLVCAVLDDRRASNDDEPK